ncbi:MAG: IPExxxVDY family protein [Chitinophagales bacterium]
MARRKLKIDPTFDFILLGIATPLHDYRLAWFLNNQLHKTFSRSEDLVITDSAGRIQRNFARFDYDEEITKSHFTLLQNRHNTGFLVPELKEMDYLLLIRSDYYRKRVPGILKKIKAIPEVQITAKVEDVENLKSRNNLILADTD